MQTDRIFDSVTRRFVILPRICQQDYQPWLIKRGNFFSSDRDQGFADFEEKMGRNGSSIFRFLTYARSVGRPFENIYENQRTMGHLFLFTLREHPFLIPSSSSISISLEVTLTWTDLRQKHFRLNTPSLVSVSFPHDWSFLLAGRRSRKCDKHTRSFRSFREEDRDWLLGRSRHAETLPEEEILWSISQNWFAQFVRCYQYGRKRFSLFLKFGPFILKVVWVHF